MASRAAIEIIIKARDDATKTLKSLGKSATAVGKTLTAGLTLPLAGIGVVAVKMAADLDREMKNIQSISKATDAEISALSQTFVDMSTDLTVTTDSAVKLAEGFYTIQGSGFAGADAMTVLEAATRAASAGLTDTEVAAKAITAGLNAYGESADQAAGFSDLMFRTVDIGVGSFEELSSSLGYVVGTASQAGVGFDEVSAALSTMSKQGIEFHKGGRALNMLLLALIKPSDDLADALLDIGYQSGQAALDSLGLAGTLKELEAAGYGGTEGFASLGLSSMSLRAALALTGTGAEMFAGDLEAMQMASEGAGAAQEAFAIQTESFHAQMANFKNIVREAGIMLGNTLLPALMDLLNQVKPLIQRFSEMDENTRKWVLVIAGVVAAVGPALIIIGQLATAVTAVGILIGAATLLQAALLIMIPVAVITAVVLLIKKQNEMNAEFEAMLPTIRETAQSYEEYKASALDAARETGAFGAAAQGMGVSAEQSMQSLGILTEEAWEIARALESSDQAMLSSIAGHQARAQAIEEAEQRVEVAIVETELAARQTAQSMDAAMQDSAEAIRSVEPSIEDMMAHMKKLARDTSAKEHADQVREMAQTVREAFRDSTIAYATFFTDIGEGIEEHKAKLIEIEEASATDVEAVRTKHFDNLFEMQRTHDHNTAEALETHAGKLQTLQTQYDQAETDTQRTQIAAKIEAEQASWTEKQSDLDYNLSEKQRKENEAYGEAETKQAEHLAATLAKEEEAYAEMQAKQREQLGQMLMQQIDVWARIDDTVAEHALEMKLVVAEEFGIITETGRQQAEDMLGFMEEWRAGGATKTDEMIVKFQEYMDKAQDGVTATEDFGSAVDSIPDIDIRHNLGEIEDGANRAKSAVDSIPSHKNVKVNFERTGWSGVQEESPKTRIQHMLEDLDSFLRRTDFTVRFGAEGLADIGSAQEVGEQISTDLIDGMTEMERLKELADAGSLLAATALDSMQKTLGPGMVSMELAASQGMVSIGETLKSDTISLHRWMDNAWADNDEVIIQSMVSMELAASQGMVSIGETLKSDTISLHRWMDNAWAGLASSIAYSMASINETVIQGTASVGFSVSGYQFGGIVPGPIGAPQLAMVHGGETIIPARAPAAPARTRGVETTRAARWDNVTVNVNALEPGPVARRVEQTLRRLSLQAELSATRG